MRVCVCSVCAELLSNWCDLKAICMCVTSLPNQLTNYITVSFVRLLTSHWFCVVVVVANLGRNKLISIITHLIHILYYYSMLHVAHWCDCVECVVERDREKCSCVSVKDTVRKRNRVCDQKQTRQSCGCWWLCYSETIEFRLRVAGVTWLDYIRFVVLHNFINDGIFITTAKWKCINKNLICCSTRTDLNTKSWTL